MVVFTCNHCGDSLHKPKVEKHYSFVCRRPKSLTCVDCFKDFRNEEYAVHTKCITEDERYAAKGSLPNGVIRKGEVKQETWIEMIKSIIDNNQSNINPSHLNMLNNISTFSNVPRKRQKFINFIKSSYGGRVNMKDIEEIWNIIETYKTKNSTLEMVQNADMTKEPQEFSGDQKSKNIDEKRKLTNAEIHEDTASEKKRKLDIVPEEDNQQNIKFSFKDEIIRMLSSKGTISLKKLEKKIIHSYLKHSEESEASSKVVKKFHRKLKKISNVDIVNDTVILNQS